MRDHHDKRAYRRSRLARAWSELGYIIGWLWYAGQRYRRRSQWAPGWRDAAIVWLCLAVVLLAGWPG